MIVMRAVANGNALLVYYTYACTELVVCNVNRCGCDARRADDEDGRYSNVSHGANDMDVIVLSKQPGHVCRGPG